MLKTISFNQWIALPGTQTRGDPARRDLATKWQVTRGRVSRETVEQRALARGAAPGVG
jgi:hypothetical protein